MYHDNKASAAELSTRREHMMKEIYRILCITLRTPPKTFTWRYYDKDKKFVTHNNLTANDYYENYVKDLFNVDEYVSIVHDPRNQANTLLTVDYLGNVSGVLEPQVYYINVDIDTMINLTKDEIIKNENPVWFGCDVGKFHHRDSGTMAIDLFNLDQTFNIKTNVLNKANRLIYGESLMTHAMVFTAVDIDENDQVIKFRVENSWSDKKGDKGYYAMSLDWFKEYNYQILLPKSSLSDELLKVLDQTPIKLPAWDPLGALA